VSIGSTAEGWYILRGETQAGPYNWEQLHGFCREGHVASDDLVWQAEMPGWLPASSVPGLFPAGAATTASQTAAGAPSQGHPTTPRTLSGTPGKKRGWVIPLVAALVAVVVLGGAVGGYFLLRGGGDGGDFAGGGGGSGGSDLGAASYTPPTPADLVETEAWGRVPINQMGVVLLDGKDRGDADKLAAELGGTVVGELEFINLYQLQVPATSEAELTALIDRVAVMEGVESAFPNQETFRDEEIWGVRSSPLDDPVYAGDNAKPYTMIGVQRAWDLIRGSGRDISAVQVGVVDDGLYKGQQEFDGKSAIAGGEAGDELGAPTKDDAGNDDVYGSHGTAVAGIIAANPDNGGQTGVASVLGDKLKVVSTNIWGPKYGVNTPVAPDPNDPTQHTFSDGTFSLGDLQALKYQVEQGSTVINCSWGNSNAHPSVAATYKKFFEKMAQEKPGVIFVCSAGNDGKALDGKKRFPSGLNLPNMITVGCLESDGSKIDYSNTIGEDFEVTLGAPGHRVVSGVDPKTGEVSNEWGGTSFATPQVTATAAMMKSLNPELTAAQIKEILTQTAAPGVTDDEKQMSVPFPHDELGAGVLSTDFAIAKVIYDLKNPSAAGKPTDRATLEKFLEEIQNQGVIDAVAVTTDDPDSYDVRGIVKALGDKGADISITLSGQGAIGGTTTQKLDAPGEVTWGVTVADESATITVRRADNGAASVITIENIDLNGAWAGTFTITAIEIPDEVYESARAGEEEGCDLAILEALKALEGQTMPMTMDITADEGGTGQATVFLDSSGLNEDGTAGDPITAPIQWSRGSFNMDISAEGGSGAFSGRPSKQGDTLVLSGSFVSSNEGITMRGAWTVTKQ